MNQLAAIIQPASRRRLRRLNPVAVRSLPATSGLRNVAVRLVCGHAPTWPVYLAVGVVTWLLVGLFVAVAILGYVWLGHRAGRSALRRAAARAASRGCGVAFASIADEFRAGRSADAALFTGIRHIETVVAQGVCAVCARHGEREWRVVRRAIPSGEKAVVSGLRAISAPFRPWADQLAAAWSLTGSGAALGDVLDSLERELEATRETERARAVHTAAARATVVVLTGLPAIGIAFGVVIGADPVGLLLRTPLGAGCLLAATGLQLLGWWWADRIASGGEGRDFNNVETLPLSGSGSRFLPKLRRLSLARLRLVNFSAPAKPARPVSDRRPRSRTVVRWSAAGLSGVAAAWCFGGALAVPVGVLSTLAMGYFLARASRSQRADPEWESHLAYALSLTAALLRSGATTPHAVSVVGRALPGPVGAVFLATGAAMRSGRSARSAWPDRYADNAAAGSFLRALDQTSHSGAALAGACERLAGQLRRDIAASSAVRAQRSGVVMVAPLMCCFLPAFVLLGVVPVVADVLHQTLSPS